MFLAWHDSRSGVLEIRYAQSTNEGMSWDADEKVSTPTATEASTPLLAVSANYVHALWLDKRTGPYQVMYRRRDRPAEAGGGDDAGTGGDGGTNPATGDDAGCGCASTRGTGGAFPLFALLAVLRRRRVR